MKDCVHLKLLSVLMASLVVMNVSGSPIALRAAETDNRLSQMSAATWLATSSTFPERAYLNNKSQSQLTDEIEAAKQQLSSVRVEGETQKISRRALTHFSHEAGDAASQAGDLFEHSGTSLRPPDSHVSSLPSTLHSSSGHLDSSRQRGASPNAPSIDTEAYQPASTQAKLIPLWHPSMEAEWRDFIWSDKDIAQLSSMDTAARKTAWRRVRTRRHRKRLAAGELVETSRSLQSLDPSGPPSSTIRRLAELRKVMHKRIKRIDETKPDANDVKGTARWQDKMNSELADKSQLTSKLSELRSVKNAAKVQARQASIETNARSKTRRSISFVGLTPEELALFQSKDASQRTKLRRSVKTRVWKAENLGLTGASDEIGRAKLRADKAWLELLDWLRDVPPATADRRVAEVMSAISGMSSIEAAEHVSAVAAQLRGSSTPAQAGTTPHAESLPGQAVHEANRQAFQGVSLPLASLPSHSLQPARPHSPTDSADSTELWAKYLAALKENASTASSSLRSERSDA